MKLLNFREITWSRRTTDLLVPNQWLNQSKSLSWRHLQFFGPLSVRQVWTSPSGIWSIHCVAGSQSYERGAPRIKREFRTLTVAIE
jgi:hypothetical protein